MRQAAVWLFTARSDRHAVRAPFRQFDPVEVVEEVVEEVIPEPEEQEEVPVRALWSKNRVAIRRLSVHWIKPLPRLRLISRWLVHFKEEQITLEWNDTTYLENSSWLINWLVG